MATADACALRVGDGGTCCDGKGVFRSQGTSWLKSRSEPDSVAHRVAKRYQVIAIKAVAPKLAWQHSLDPHEDLVPLH